MLAFFDQATIRCGFCIGDGRTNPNCGTFHLPGMQGGKHGQLLQAFEEHLNNLRISNDIRVIGYESPIINKRLDTVAKIRGLYSVAAFLEYFAVKHRIEVVEVSPAAVKSSLTGIHNATKDQMVAIAKRAQIPLPANKQDQLDAADAFGGWLLLLSLYDTKTRAKWDQRLLTGRLTKPASEKQEPTEATTQEVTHA